MKKIYRLVKPVIVLTMVLAASSANSYKLSPSSTPEEKRLSGITNSYFAGMESAIVRVGLENFGSPVHEEITNRIYGCDGDESICAGSNAESAPSAVLAGVRWNDDPPFRLAKGQAKGLLCNTSETVRFETQPTCWATLFKAANEGAANGKKYGHGYVLLYRSHFGDLQFLHAMASMDGERASDTKEKILNWAEFSWRSSLGEYTVDTRLKDVKIPLIQAAFGKTGWRLLELYTLGSGNKLRTKIDDVAFGSLLHMLQDSYAAGHVNREESSGTASCDLGAISVTAPGAILEFHSYGKQDHAKHGAADSRESFMRKLQEHGDVVEIGRALATARKQKIAWEVARPFFDCVFNVAFPEAAASPGDEFEKTLND